MDDHVIESDQRPDLGTFQGVTLVIHKGRGSDRIDRRKCRTGCGQATRLSSRANGLWRSVGKRSEARQLARLAVPNGPQPGAVLRRAVNTPTTCASRPPVQATPLSSTTGGQPDSCFTEKEVVGML